MSFITSHKFILPFLPLLLKAAIVLKNNLWEEFMSKRDNYALVGILYMLAAMFMFSSVNAIAKDALGRYSLFQIIFVRSFFSLIPMFYLMQREGGFKILKTTQLPRMILVGIVGTCAMMGLFASIYYLPLAEAVTIHFTEILIITGLSAVVLKEHVGVPRWTAIVVGFIGVLIIFRPTGDILNIGALYGLGFAIGDAIYMINARIMTQKDSSTAIVIYFSLTVSFITGLALPWVWVTPDAADLARLIILGLGGGIGQFWMTQAYRHAPAGTVAPMIYTALIWNLIFGYVFWGDIPDTTLIIGAGLIVGSGLFIIIRETQKHKPITAAAPTGVPDREI